MKLSWFVISLLAGIAGGIVLYLLIGSWQIALIGAIALFVVVLVRDPKRRYMRAFGLILAIFTLLNGYYFSVEGQMSNIHFSFGNNDAADSVNIVLLILAAFALLLDFLERNDKLAGTFFEIRKNKIGNVSGNNIIINQHINDKES